MARYYRLLYSMLFISTLGTLNHAQQDELSFDLKLKKALIDQTGYLQKEFVREFEAASQTLRTYTFDFENQTAEQVFNNFKDFIEDTAFNYTIAMYNKVMSTDTGIEKLVFTACPPTDPLTQILSKKGCVIGPKEEYLIQEAEDVLIAIAYEYSRKLRQIGYDIINETGLLQKVIDIKMRALTQRDLPSLKLEDPIWQAQFEKTKASVWSALWNTAQKTVQQTVQTIIDSFQKDIDDVAAAQIETWVKSAQSPNGPLMKSIMNYRTKLSNLKTYAVGRLDDLKTRLGEDLKNIQENIRRSTMSFVQYLHDTIITLTDNQLISPVNKRVDDLLSITQDTDITQSTSGALTTPQDTVQKKITSLTTSVNSVIDTLDGQMQNITTTLAQPLKTLQQHAETTIKSLDVSSLTATLPTSIRQEVQGITSLFTAATTSIGTDFNNLTDQFITPVSKSIQEIKAALNTLSTLKPFGDPSQVITQEASKKIREPLMATLREFKDKLAQFSQRLSELFDTQSQEIITRVDNSVDILSTLATTTHDQLIKYIEGKINLISQLIDLIDASVKKFQDATGEDFVELAKVFLQHPSAALKVLEDLVTCKEPGEPGQCKVTYAAYFKDTLQVDTVATELGELYTTIADDLQKSFDTFIDSMQHYIQDQQKNVVGLFDQLVTSAPSNGQQSLEDTLKSIVSAINDLKTKLKTDIINQMQPLADVLNTLQKQSDTIITIFGDAQTLDTLIATLMKNKDTALETLSTAHSRIGILLAKLREQAGSEVLRAKLDDIQGVINSFKETLQHTFPSINITSSLKDNSAIIKSIVDISTNNVDSLTESLLGNNFNTLSEAVESLLSLIDDRDNVFDGIFNTVLDMVRKLNKSMLELISDGRTLGDNSAAVKNAIQQAVEAVNKTMPALLMSVTAKDTSVIAVLNSPQAASQVQQQLTKILPVSLLNRLSITTSNNQIIIEPDIASITTDHFKMLLDEVREVVADEVVKIVQTLA